MVTLSFQRRADDGRTTTLIGDLLCAPDVDADQILDLVRDLERGADRADELTLALSEFDATLEKYGCPSSAVLRDDLITRALSRVSFAAGRLATVAPQFHDNDRASKPARRWTP
jgi:hypothetical protein